MDSDQIKDFLTEASCEEHLARIAYRENKWFKQTTYLLSRALVLLVHHKKRSILLGPSSFVEVTVSADAIDEPIHSLTLRNEKFRKVIEGKPEEVIDLYCFLSDRESVTRAGDFERRSLFPNSKLGTIS